jgi:hypothetical protein
LSGSKQTGKKKGREGGDLTLQSKPNNIDRDGNEIEDHSINKAPNISLGKVPRILSNMHIKIVFRQRKKKGKNAYFTQRGIA